MLLCELDVAVIAFPIFDALLDIKFVLVTVNLFKFAIAPPPTILPVALFDKKSESLTVTFADIYNAPPIDTFLDVAVFEANSHLSSVKLPLS